jgi:AsmA family protein
MAQHTPNETIRHAIRPWHYVLGVVVVACAVLVAVWDWDWFIPLAQREASSSLGRPVTIQHLHIHIARNPIIEVRGLVIGNPPGFSDSEPFANIDRLAVTLDSGAYLHSRRLLLPVIEIDHPVISAVQLPDGQNNWGFASTAKGGAGPTLGDLRISDGQVHAVIPKLKADFNLAVATSTPDGGGQAQVVVDAKGTYAAQPITGHLVGGALLSLRDKKDPYPVDLKLENGATKVALSGTVQDPLAFEGADIKADLSGPDLSQLSPLTGIALPQTAPYRLTGHINDAGPRIRFTDIRGTVGKSDLSGTISVDPGQERPQVNADLTSRRVDLTDLGGFIGATPDRPDKPGETVAQKREAARAQADPRLLPDTKISLPRLRFADVKLTYHGARIEGRSMPLDNLTANMTVQNGAVDLNPLDFGVGKGRIRSRIALNPVKDGLHARAHIDFQKLDLARIMASTHTFGGAGTIAGEADVDGTGSSFAGIVGNGDGGLKLFMTGGDISAVLVDLSGLEFGNSLMSALGMPKRTQIRCLVTDFVLRHGDLQTRTFLLDTGEANVTGSGHINMRDEAIDLTLKTEAKHFSIGSLPGPIVITGRLKSPSIRPGVETAVRGGLAAGLSALLTPLAGLLPTIQLGLGEDNNCAAMIRDAQKTPNRPEPKRQR